MQVAPLYLNLAGNESFLTAVAALHWQQRANDALPSDQCGHALASLRAGAVVNIVMEYLPGGTLVDAVKALHAVSPSYWLATARSLLEALAYMHDRGVIHRDIKVRPVLSPLKSRAFAQS